MLSLMHVEAISFAGFTIVSIKAMRFLMLTRVNVNRLFLPIRIFRPFDVCSFREIYEFADISIVPLKESVTEPDVLLCEHASPESLSISVLSVSVVIPRVSVKSRSAVVSSIIRSSETKKIPFFLIVI